MKVLNNSLMRAERMFGSRSIECNINPLVGAALVTGGAGILSGLFGSHSKAKAQRETNATNLQIARETNEMQQQMNRENNMFSAEEAEKAWNRQVDMFNMENEYNTPAAQRARMEEAGFNPFVGQSGSMAYGAAADGGGAPAASAGTSGISPVMAHVQPVPSVWNGISDAFLEGLSKVSDAYAKVQQGEKTGSEKKRLDATYEAFINEQFANARYAEAKASHEQLVNSLDQINLPTKYKLDLRKLQAEAIEAEFRGNVADQEAAIKTWEAKMVQIEHDLKGEQLAAFKEQRPWMLKQLEETCVLIREQQKTEQSKQSSNYAAAKSAIASAALSFAHAHGIRIQNEYLVDRIERELSGMDVDQLSKVMTTLFDTNKFSEGGKVSGPFGLGFSWNDTKSHSNGDDNENYARFVLDAIRKAASHNK